MYLLTFDCEGFQLIWIGHDQCNGERSNGVCVDTNVVEQEACFQLRFDFAQRDVLARLKFHQVFLAIDNLNVKKKEKI